MNETQDCLVVSIGSRKEVKQEEEKRRSFEEDEEEEEEGGEGEEDDEEEEEEELEEEEDDDEIEKEEEREANVEGEEEQQGVQSIIADCQVSGSTIIRQHRAASNQEAPAQFPEMSPNCGASEDNQESGKTLCDMGKLMSDNQSLESMRLESEEQTDSPNNVQNTHYRCNTNNSSATTTNDLERRYRPQKYCAVCGDKAIACNFNAVTCESCKAFFRRNAFKEQRLKCLFESRCIIDRVTRRFCSRCRLLKCFAIGMKREWILTDEQKQIKKVKILQNKQTKKQSAHSSSSPSQSDDLQRRPVQVFCQIERKINPDLSDKGSSLINSTMSSQSKQIFKRRRFNRQNAIEYKDASTSCPDEGELSSLAPRAVNYCSFIGHCQYCSYKLNSAVSPMNSNQQVVEYQQHQQVNRMQYNSDTTQLALETYVDEQISQSHCQTIGANGPANSCCRLDFDNNIQHFNHQHQNHIVQQISNINNTHHQPTHHHQPSQMPHLHLMTPSQVGGYLGESQHISAAANLFTAKQHLSNHQVVVPTTSVPSGHHGARINSGSMSAPETSMQAQNDKSFITTNSYAQQYGNNQSRNVNPFVMALEVAPLYTLPEAPAKEVSLHTNNSAQIQVSETNHNVKQTTTNFDQTNSIRINDVQMMSVRDGDPANAQGRLNIIESLVSANSLNPHGNHSNIQQHRSDIIVNDASGITTTCFNSTQISPPPTTTTTTTTTTTMSSQAPIINQTLSAADQEKAATMSPPNAPSDYIVIWNGDIYFAPAITELEVRSRLLKCDFSENERQLIEELVEATKFMFESSSHNCGNKSQQPPLNDIVNFCDAALRKLIKTVKQIRAFRMLSMDDQIVLLKTACFKILLLRSTFHYRADIEGWLDSKTGTIVTLDFLKRAKKSLVYEKHKELFNKIPEPLRRDRLMMSIITMALLFDPNINLKHSNSVKLDNLIYLSILRKYLIKTQPDPLTKYQSLVSSLEAINDCNEEYNVFFSKDFQPEQITPLLIEIFDISMDGSI